MTTSAVEAAGEGPEGVLRLRELVAIGVGGMIGGGIFSVLGLAASIAGPGVPVAFALGAVVAATSGYAYIRLALAFRRNGASYTYLRQAFPGRPRVAAVVGWTVVIGYVGTLALYAFTFGAYVADLLGRPASGPTRLALSAAVLVAFAAVNLRGVRTSGLTEDLLVYGKIGLLVVLAGVGLTGTRSEGLTPVLEEGLPAVLMAGALVFVAFEGFQLITNTVEQVRDPERDVPAGIYLSIAITTTLYIVLAVVALGHLSLDEIEAAEEYTLAVAAEPVLGEVGRVLVAVAAALATSSAINSTLLGASQMTARMSDDRVAPGWLQAGPDGVPRAGVVTIAALGAVLTLAGSLELIATFSSITFLLVTFCVGLAAFRLRSATRARPTIVLGGMALNVLTVALLVAYLAGNEPWTLVGVVAFYAATAAAAVVASRHARHIGTT